MIGVQQTAFRRRIRAALLALLLSGAMLPGAASTAEGLQVPATYRGVLPCADCEGIDYHLNLWPDGAFQLRRTWLPDEDGVAILGQWEHDEETGRLSLSSAGERVDQFEILFPERLRLLDILGKPIESGLPYELVAEAGVEPIDIQVPIIGMLATDKVGYQVTECMTGQSFLLADAGGMDDLEAALGPKGESDDAEILLTGIGFVEAGGAEGELPRIGLERFAHLWPKHDCDRFAPPAPLSGTYWRILELGDGPVPGAERRREPHLVLDGARNAISATAGCNDLAGTYDAEGDKLTITPVASTRKACLPPLDEADALLVHSLEAAATWQIIGQSLELLDDARARVALLEAVYLP